MFKIENSKFYTEIMGTLVSFFGKDPESTTEAELHQSLIEAGTVAEAKAAAVASVKTQLDQLQTSITDLQTQITDLQTEAATAKTQLDAVTVQLAEKQTEAATAKTQLASANAKITTLSGEIANLKAGGKSTDQSQTTDDGMNAPKDKAAKFGTVINGDFLSKSLFGK